MNLVNPILLETHVTNNSGQPTDTKPTLFDRNIKVTKHSLPGVP